MEIKGPEQRSCPKRTLNMENWHSPNPISTCLHYSVSSFQFPLSKRLAKSKLQRATQTLQEMIVRCPSKFDLAMLPVMSWFNLCFPSPHQTQAPSFMGMTFFFFFFKCWHEIFETFVPSEVLFQKTETKNRSQDQTHHVLETRKESRSFEVEGIHHEQLLISNLICYSFEMAWHAFTLKEIAMINSVPLSKKKKKELTLYSCKRFEKLSTYHMVP